MTTRHLDTMRSWWADTSQFVRTRVMKGDDDPIYEDEARLITLFSKLMIMSLFLALGLVVAFAIAGVRGYFRDTAEAVIGTLFPLLYVPLSVFCYVMARRGRVRQMSRLYVWSNYVAISMAAILFSGYQSAGWLLLFWPIALAGTLLRPSYALYFATATVIVYALTALVQTRGWYTPPLLTTLENFRFLGMAFALLMIVFEVGGITYLSNSSLRAALRQVSETSHELELARRNLTQRVEMRTAELSDRAEQFRTIAELNQATSSVGDVDTLLTTVVELIARRLGFYHVGVFVLDPEGEWAVLQAASSEGGRRMIERGHRLRVGQQGIVGHVAEMGTARLAFDVGEDAVWFNNPDLPETQSEMALPLIANQRIIGVMDIQSEEAAAFDEDDVETLRVLANGVANSLANTRLLEETQRTVAQLERYQRENAVRAWRQALARRNLRVGYRYQSGMVQAVDGDDGAARLVEQAEDIALEPTEDGQYRLLAPISVGGRRLGLLSFVRSSPWTEETVQLVESVTNQLDLALDNARLLEETRLRATQEAARSDIVGRVRALTSTDAILRSAAEELGRALQVERSRIQLIQFNE